MLIADFVGKETALENTWRVACGRGEVMAVSCAGDSAG